MRDALPALGIEGRIGVTTGEVVTGTAERLATGDAVNLAARLEQAARPGEVLIGSATHGLVAGVVDAEPVEPLVLKGKSEPVPAFRLPRRHRRAGAAARRADGRARAPAPRARGRVRERLRRPRLPPLHRPRRRRGRQVAAGGRVPATASTRRVVRGRCLSYGDGITLWPVVEVLQALGTRPDDERAAAAIAAVLGESDEPMPTDEIAWAVRKTFEEAAHERPLVVVWDDLHWAEPAFLDLVEHVADCSRGAPILLLCMARPELLDRRAGWAGGKVNATTVLLEPLSAEETDELIERLAPVDAGLRARIREAAEGNPLFVEEMLALVQELGRRRRRRPADDPGAAGRAARPARAVRARGARARGGRGQGVPPRRRGGARTGGPPGAAAAARARPQGARPPGPADARRRRRLPLPAPADPRRRVRRAAEGRARRAAPALRRLAGAHGEGVVELDEITRPPPRAGVALPGRARAAGRRRVAGGGTGAPDGGHRSAP